MDKKPLSEKYEVGLMIASLCIVAVMGIGLTVFPEQGVALSHKIMNLLTHSFGSVMQLIALGILLFLIVLALSKYGDIRLGNLFWVAMMFFCGNGAGTVYWAFLEWGYHFNAAPQLNGAEISEAYNYEQSLAYCFYDWGPIAWAMLCVFVLPFAYLRWTREHTADAAAFAVLLCYSRSTYLRVRLHSKALHNSKCSKPPLADFSKRSLRRF